MSAVKANLKASADAAYCSEENLAGLGTRSIDGYWATGRARNAVASTAKERLPVFQERGAFVAIQANASAAAPPRSAPRAKEVSHAFRRSLCNDADGGVRC
jgi:hypothetical protein